MSTQPEKIVTIDNEQYRLVLIWVDYQFELGGEIHPGKRQVFALDPIPPKHKQLRKDSDGKA